MLSYTLKAFDRACGPTTGGISRIWIFDRNDFTFTQGAADTDGTKPAYSAVALRTGATAAAGALLYPVKFSRNEAEYKYDQTRGKGGSVKYAHSVEFFLPDLGQFITNWNEKIDAAGICDGIGLIVELNSGKIIVLGEKYVGSNLAPNWEIVQDGASGSSGKLNDDANGHTAVLKGDNGRGAYEYTGTVASLVALETAA